MGISGKKLDEQTRARIYKERVVEGLSVRNVARRNDVARRTVEKYGRRRA